ncbi:tRNA 2-thiouridine(34) synthase MnmA [Patescibacteria group bacterium]|nr:tRNA 2-thiouridine(34) synthase MnmA [Patescibacteria group bacterium]
MLKAQNQKKIAVAMSGGVDSSVAAFLLKEKNGIKNVFGMTMRAGRFHQLAVERAKIICQRLKITHYVVNLEKEFQQEIIKPFVDEYCQSHTPNPCVWCNQKIKFGVLLEAAQELGANYLATGHYVRQESKEGNYILRKALSSKKDQSYFLYRLNQKQLSSAIFPLGIYSKEEVKETAQNNSLSFEKQKESQDICFLPDNDYRKLLQRDSSVFVPAGSFKDLEGNVLGRHQGLPFYTIGQRKGLISGQKEPFYVLEINQEKNEIILGPEKYLYQKKLKFENCSWVNPSFVLKNKEESFFLDQIRGKIRYQHPVAQIENFNLSNNLKQGEVRFKSPQRAITPGQSVVFYLQDQVLGGGFISK